MKLRTIYINDQADLQTLVAEAASLMSAMQLDTPEIVENIFKHAYGAAKNLARSAARAPVDIAKQKYSKLSSGLQGLGTSATPWGDIRQHRAAKGAERGQRRTAKREKQAAKWAQRNAELATQQKAAGIRNYGPRSAQPAAAAQPAKPAAAAQPAAVAQPAKPAAGGAGKLSPTKIADNLLTKLGQLDPVTQKQLARMLLHHLQPYSK